MTKNIIERGAQAESIYNTDETGFGRKISINGEMSIQRSIYLWGKPVEISFNITIVTRVSVSNHVVPIIFIFTGKRLNRDGRG